MRDKGSAHDNPTNDMATMSSEARAVRAANGNQAAESRKKRRMQRANVKRVSAWHNLEEQPRGTAARQREWQRVREAVQRGRNTTVQSTVKDEGGTRRCEVQPHNEQQQWRSHENEREGQHTGNVQQTQAEAKHDKAENGEYEAKRRGAHMKRNEKGR